ncbi:MAG TPA: hypothetical protein VFF65_03875 [Phycisphaerales bacterium]|nr:hypothetical protein [Phycisphaerales bacterium]
MSVTSAVVVVARPLVPGQEGKVTVRTRLASLLVASVGVPALGQVYTLETRLIADGDAGSPGGPTGATTFTRAAALEGGGTTVRVGFWLQSRVSVTGSTNWGICRVGPGSVAQGTSFILVSDPSQAASLSRGEVNASETLFGRGVGFRFGGPNSGNVGNVDPAPGHGNQENGRLDNGGFGTRMTRISAFDCYVGPLRDDSDADGDGDVDDDGDGVPENPWGVNGSTHPGGVDGVPTPADTFSPWANLYRFYVDVDLAGGDRSIAISMQAAALYGGETQWVPGSAGTFVMRPVPTFSSELTTATYTLLIPSPGSAGLLVLGGLAAARRRR